MRILAVDPGDMTGLAEWTDGEFMSRAAPTWAAITLVEEKLDTHTVDLLVCEAWKPRPGSRTWEPSAVESIGALRYLAQKYGAEFDNTQDAASMKRFRGPRFEKLKVLGWRNPMPGDHADDAAGHLLLACVRHQLIDPAVFLR